MCSYSFVARLARAQWQSGTEGKIYRSAGLTAEILWQDLRPVWIYERWDQTLNPLWKKMEQKTVSSCCPKFKLRKSREPCFWHLYYTRRQHICPVHKAINLDNVKCIGTEDETKIWPDWLWKGLAFGPSWEIGGLTGGVEECFAQARTNAKSFDLSVWLVSFPEWETSLGVQNKHTLIPQLIKGTNTGGETLKGPFWLHIVHRLMKPLCAHMCMHL